MAIKCHKRKSRTVTLVLRCELQTKGHEHELTLALVRPVSRRFLLALEKEFTR